MEFEAIEQKFEKGSLLPVNDVWGHSYSAPIRIDLILKNREEGITFFKTANATYPDLEDEYLLFLQGMQIKVYIFWYLEDKVWKVKWYTKRVEAKALPLIEKALAAICKEIGFPSKMVKDSPYPLRITGSYSELIR